MTTRPALPGQSDSGLQLNDKVILMKAGRIIGQYYYLLHMVTNVTGSYGVYLAQRHLEEGGRERD